MVTILEPSNLARPGKWVVTAFGDPSVLQWNTTSIPNPEPQTARIRILICGVSGADNIMRTGAYTRFPQTSKPGFTPGYEIVGIIEEFGKDTDTKGFQVGDVVASIVVVGGYGTHLVVPVDDLLKLDKSDDLVKVAALPVNYMTAYGMIRRSAFPVDRRTSSVLIGSVAGGVGTAVAQLLRLWYPKVKIFGSASPAKFDYIRSLGVTPVDRYTAPKDLPQVIRSLNGGKGVDIAYDAIGSPDVMEAFLASTDDKRGKLIAIGFIANVKVNGTGIEDTLFNPIQWCTDRSDRASFFSVTNHFWKAQREAFKETFELEVLQAVRTGDLDPKVTKLWRLDDATELHHALASGEGVMGKNEIIVDQEAIKEYSPVKRK